MRRIAGDAGLTLVELAVGLAILSILLALSVSLTGLIDNRRLAGAARMVAEDIRYVQQEARGERQCWRIVFDPDGERYGIDVLEGETAGPSMGCTPGRTGRWRNVRLVRLPPPIDLQRTTFAQDRLVLSPFGTAGGGAVLFRTPGGAARAVRVGDQGNVTVGRSSADDGHL